MNSSNDLGNNQLYFQSRLLMLWKLSLHITKEIRVGVFRRAACSRNLKKLMVKLTYQKNVFKNCIASCLFGECLEVVCIRFARILSLSLSLKAEVGLFQGFDSMTCHFLFSCLCVPM